MIKEFISVADPNKLKSEIAIRFNSILKAFTTAMYLAGAGVIVGLVLKYLQLPGQHVVFIFSLSALTFFLLLQTGISFVYVFSLVQLAFLGAFSSLSLAMACIMLVFMFENWWGVHITIYLAGPLLVLSSIFLLAYFITRQHRHTTHRRFLYRNILYPFLFVLALIMFHEFYVEKRLEDNPGQNEDVRTA